MLSVNQTYTADQAFVLQNAVISCACMKSYIEETVEINIQTAYICCQLMHTVLILQLFPNFSFANFSKINVLAHVCSFMIYLYSSM